MLEGYTLSNDMKTPYALNNASAMKRLEVLGRLNTIMKEHEMLYRETILADKSQSRRYTVDTCQPLRDQWRKYLSSAINTAMPDLEKWSRSGAADPLVKHRIEQELANTPATKNGK
jgi:hypothetical protein